MFQFPWSASTFPMYSEMSNCELPQLGFPIRTPPDQSLLTAPRGSFVVRHVLRRLLAPRHPPCALISLTSIFPQENIGHCISSEKKTQSSTFRLESSYQLITISTCLHKFQL